MPTQMQVSESLNNATDNGSDFECWTFMDAAQDLVQNDSSMEGCRPEDIAPMVKVWFLGSGVGYRMYEHSENP